jgi:hypothetical protein
MLERAMRDGAVMGVIRHARNAARGKTGCHMISHVEELS